MNYIEKLKDPRWQRKRLEIFKRDNFCCLMCSSDTDTLHVHHEKYCKNPWDVDDQHLKTLCFRCHKIAEICKIEDVKFTNVNKLSYGQDVYVYLLNHHLQDGRTSLLMIYNGYDDREFKVIGRFSKDFIDIMINTF